MIPKQISFLFFLSLLILVKSVPGGWNKGSFRENDIGIDRAFKKAFEVYSKDMPNSDIDFTQPLTIYRQIVNGINYLICFIDLNNDLNIIQEFKISGPDFSNTNRNEEFEFLERKQFEPDKGLISTSDSRYKKINDIVIELSKTWKENFLYIIKIEKVETTFDNFFIVTGRSDNKLKTYVIGQSKENTDEFEFYGILK